MVQDKPYLNPVDGKFIFQVDHNIRVRFNADGWVEEIGKGGPDDPVGTVLNGKPGTKSDDIFARRYYDLYSRVVLIDIHPHRHNDYSGTEGLFLFKDIDPDAVIYQRIAMIIDIANQKFGMNIKPLS